MATSPSLQRITEAELDPLFAKLRREGTTELILLGPAVDLPASADRWPQELRDKPKVYQLTEWVEGLAVRLVALTQLTSLNLEGNEIGDAGAASLAALSQLTSLQLGDNQIGDAGAASLSSLPKLTSLSLWGNRIGAAGATSLSSLPQLTSLNLQANQIRDKGAASLAALSQLTSLNLGHTQIGPPGAASLAALTQLTSLDLWSNQIGDAGAAYLAALSQLTSLDLRGNQIGDAGVNSLASLTELTALNLSENPVRETTAFASLKRLTKLNLRDTKVEDLSPLQGFLKGGLEAEWEMYDFDFDIGINVCGCPLVHPPPEIVQQGQEAVLNYLREIDQQGIAHLYEGKVLILGEGAAGKTSLLRRLYCTDLPLPAEEESTKGIHIQRHEFANARGKSFRLNVWDFGGQQIYHATHQFFLTKRSLYILVDDTRNNSTTVHDKGFKSWLEMIEVFSESSPVLIFQNEKAGRSKNIDEAGIKGRFPNVKDVFRGNLEQLDAADQLAEAICYHVQQLPHVGEAVPAQWLTIRSVLEERKQREPYLSRNEYFQIYRDHLEWDETKALRLSQYLHDLGMFLHYQEDPLLARTVILQNEWATDAVFKVLDDEPTKARSGFFTRQDCQRIWSDSTYAEMHPELLALMEKFELCYKLPDQPSDTWLMPQLLSPSAPEALMNWGQPEDLVLTYSYEFLPKGLINRLMVRMNRYVRQPDLSWASGAYFEQGPSDLLAQISASTGQEIELRARGPEGKALLSVIASELDALNGSFEGLRDKVRKLVPCLCSRCKPSTTPERFEEARLLKRKQDGKLSIECPESYEEVSVLELLDGLRSVTLPQWAMAAPVPPSAEPLKTIRIFLASSSELREARDAFDLYFRLQNDRWIEKGIYLKIERWEIFLDAMSETRKQDDYNEKVRSCDIFVSLFKTKTGKFTEEEFDLAHAAFKESGKPLIYTYFMQTDVPNDKALREALNSLWSFQEKLTRLGHYYSFYSSIEDLKLKFKDQLEQLIEGGKI